MSSTQEVTHDVTKGCVNKGWACTTAHPAGVKGVGQLALMSALVLPRTPLADTAFTAITTANPTTLVTRSRVLGLFGAGSELLLARGIAAAEATTTGFTR